MKAIVYEKYGPPEVLFIKEVDKPELRKNHVLIKIKYAAVTSGDCRIRGFDVPKRLWLLSRLVLGITKPRKQIPGLWFSGIIEEIDENVTKFKTGDEVWARTNNLEFGAYAEYISLSQNGFIALKPKNATFEEAAAIPFGALTALYFLKRGKIKANKKVLIYGASGAVGSAAVQIAKHFDCEVTGVTSTENQKMIKDIGADFTMDYKKENMSNIHKKYDLIFDAVGKINKETVKNALNKHAAYISVLTSGHADPEVTDLDFIRDLFESGKYNAVIDKCYSLEEMVEAQKYVETGHKKGNVVVRIWHNN